MDDNSSVLSSCYWDAASVTSDGTIPTDMFHTPTGSLLDMHAPDEMCVCDESSDSLTPVFQEMRIPDDSIDEPQIDPIDGVVVAGEEDPPADDKRRNSAGEQVVPVLRPVLIRQKNEEKEEGQSGVVEKNQESPKRKNWKRDLARRLTTTRSRIMRSFSIDKYKEENRQHSKSIFQSVRQSIRRIRSHDKRADKEARDRWSKDTQTHASESTSAIIGSDCEYFNFVKEQNAEIALKNEQLSLNSDTNEDTPLKPRRQFTQEKYITGSKDTLQKVYNTLKRKSYVPNDKSLFDICSTVSNLFTCDPHLLLPLDEDKKLLHKFMERCVNAFLEVHKKQIENSLSVINKTIGEHIDLNTPNLDVINKSKKYQVTEIFGSKGICMITNTANKDQFIALKTSSPTNWIRLTSFLQHIEDSGPAPNQEWICFPAQSVTNVYIEKVIFNVRHVECQQILETLVQLILLLCSRSDSLHIKTDLSNILLISSNLSLIVVFTDMDEESSTDEKKRFSSLSFASDKERRRAYQEAVMKLHKYVDKFLSSPENSSHFIRASYPLDYLFYLLLKLHKDINNLIKSL